MILLETRKISLYHNKEEQMLKKKKLLISLLFIGLAAWAGFIAAASPIKMEKIAVSKLPDNMIIGHMGTVTVDAKGNVFAFTSTGKDCSVIKFSPNLEFICQFGSNGKGPGEFSTVYTGIDNRISIDKDGNVHVTDSNPSRIIVFDNNGNYTKKELMLFKMGFHYVRDPKVLINWKYAALSFNTETRGSEGVLMTIDPPGLKTLYVFNERKIVDEYGNHAMSRYYGGYEHIDSDSEHFVFANASVFRFLVFDKNGKLTVKVEDAKRKENSFSGKEMDKIEGQNKSEESKEWFKKYRGLIRDHKNFIEGIHIAGDRVYVFAVGDTTITGSVPVEIYNLKGRLIKKGTMPDWPAEIWKNYGYFLDRTSEDDPIIIKYRILE
jgi:hypothetical protein